MMITILTILVYNTYYYRLQCIEELRIIYMFQKKIYIYKIVLLIVLSFCECFFSRFNLK